MPKFTSQINIIKKIKGLVRKAQNTFARTSQNGNISEKMALQIQKNAYETSRKQIKDTYTPVYKEIAEQIQVGDDQIFKAAVFDLINIAKNRHNKDEIIAILEKQQKNPQRTPEQIEYITQKLSQLN